MLSRLKSAMASVWNISVETIPDNAELNEFSAWDSMGHISMLLALESEFGLELNKENVHKLRSIPTILQALSAFQTTQSTTKLDQEPKKGS